MRLPVALLLMQLVWVRLVWVRLVRVRLRVVKEFAHGAKVVRSVVVRLRRRLLVLVLRSG